MNLPLRLPVAETGSAVDADWVGNVVALAALFAKAACWLRAVLMRSSAPLSCASEALGPEDKLGSGVDVPDSSADDAKDGKQNPPKAS